LFTSAGLTKKEAVILVVAAKHSDSITRRLEQEGFKVPELQESGQLVFADAEQVLATFLFDGVIDEHKFKTGVGSMVDAAKTYRGRNRPVRLFGEMVDLIWISNPQATLRLEQLWNELVESYPVTVLCAYSIGGRRPNSVPAPPLGCHSHAVSVTRHDVEFRCPNCGSDLVIIDTKAIANELVECRSCMKLYEIKHDASGTPQLLPV
jgi:predicted RNA-binding Zn-ribbon protein involved in translation (DUF1610 family)